MKVPFLLAFLAAAAPMDNASSDPASMPASLARAAAEFDRAQIGGDAAALRRLLADDYVLFNSGAQVEDKAAFIRDYTTDGFSLKPYRVEQEVIRIWPHGAVLGGVVTLDGSSGGKPFKARLRFADVWREQDGVWQVVFTQATRLP
ncbi:nuclear transport factor 2 family protein [Luteibacter jiangsuensis]|uniref:Nuclear transport factor 2 family protein n=1 Tax=Luteibacter jiangsuensis TaxID=637577 RepID=A0ABX0Q3H7_9GAMM|nr:nuclear transport factor 2 family protein [Luteibacter jiangsuensis]NID04514.1 nuclear transport factor 2 family protein [Luteibacter jiangsuensis]